MEKEVSVSFDPGEHIEEKPWGKESLKVFLTPEETKAYNEQLVKALQELDQADADLRAVKATYKKDMDAKAALVKSLSQKLSNGYEFRPVQVIQRKDYDAKTVAYIREDTGEVVRTAIMTADELQKYMFPGEE